MQGRSSVLPELEFSPKKKKKTDQLFSMIVFMNLAHGQGRGRARHLVLSPWPGASWNGKGEKDSGSCIVIKIVIASQFAVRLADSCLGSRGRGCISTLHLGVAFRTNNYWKRTRNSVQMSPMRAFLFPTDAFSEEASVASPKLAIRQPAVDREQYRNQLIKI